MNSSSSSCSLALAVKRLRLSSSGNVFSKLCSAFLIIPSARMFAIKFMPGTCLLGFIPLMVTYFLETFFTGLCDSRHVIC